RDASPTIRQRIVDSPELFLKAQQQVEPQEPTPAEELVRDLTMVQSLIQRAGRRIARAMPRLDHASLEHARHKVECAQKDLMQLAQRIQWEQSHVESSPTHGDSGAPPAGHPQTRDRAGLGSLAFVGTQSPALELVPIAGTGSPREGRTVPDTDPGI